MNELIKQINEFAKYQYRRNSKLKVFALTDPKRSESALVLEKELDINIEIILRTFGDENLIIDLKKPHRFFATIGTRTAKKYNIKGVHIPSKRKNHLNYKNQNINISASAHNLRQIHRALKFKADFILVSVAFFSKSPSATSRPLGPIKIANICRLFPKANIIALGGINIKTAKRLEKIGIKGFAGVSFKN